jgi:hypothetical protein
MEAERTSSPQAADAQDNIQNNGVDVRDEVGKIAYISCVEDKLRGIDIIVTTFNPHRLSMATKWTAEEYVRSLRP